jgi:hypothetical protein
MMQEDSLGAFLPPAVSTDGLSMLPYMVAYGGQFSPLVGNQTLSSYSWPDHVHRNAWFALPAIAENAGFSNSGMTETRTTVMLKGLPEGYTRSDLLQLFDDEGFFGRFDFLYVPVDFKKQRNLGYALVNAVSPSEAVRLRCHFEGFSQWRCPCSNICETVWSDPHQGLQTHVERYRNSPVMHGSVPGEWRPLLRSHGVPMGFPEPTVNIKAPKMKTRH